MFDLLWSGLAQSAAGNQGIEFAIDKLARVPISKIVIFAFVLTIIRVALFKFLKDRPVHMRDGLYSFLKFVNDISDALLYAAIVVFMLVRPFGIQTFFIPSQSMVDTLRIKDYIVANKFIYRTSEPKAGDIIVFKPPKLAIQRGFQGQTQVQPETDFIKRCVGAPGDVVEIKGIELYRNGELKEEKFKAITDPLQNQLEVLPKEEWEGNPGMQGFNNFKLIEFEGEIVPLAYNSDNRAAIYNQTTAMRVFTDAAAADLINQEAQPIPKNKFLMVGDNRNGSFDGRFWGLIDRKAVVGKAEFVWLPIKRAKGLPSDSK